MANSVVQKSLCGYCIHNKICNIKELYLRDIEEIKKIRFACSNLGGSCGM